MANLQLRQLRLSLRLFGQNNVVISKNLDTQGKAALLAQGITWVKFCLPALCFLMGLTEGKNRSSQAIRMKNSQTVSSSMTPSWTLLLLHVLYCGALIGRPDFSKN